MPTQEPFAALRDGDLQLVTDVWEKVLAKKRARRGRFGRLFGGGPLGVGLGWVGIIALVMEIIRLVLAMRQGVALEYPSYDADVMEAYGEAVGE
jgi:hypothetical protein